MYDITSLYKVSDVAGIDNEIAHFAIRSSHASSTEHMVSSMVATFSHRRAVTFLLPQNIIIGQIDAKDVLVRSVPLGQLRSRLVHNAFEHEADDLSYPFW